MSGESRKSSANARGYVESEATAAHQPEQEEDEMTQFHVPADQIEVMATGSMQDPECEVATGLLAEASTIGLAPGEWPDIIIVDDAAGVTRLFSKETVTRHPYGDIIAVDYVPVGRTDGIFRLTVLND